MPEKSTYKFLIIKNYPETKNYELLKRKKDLLASVLEKIGLKKG